jgi:peroxiredoxin
VKLHEAIQSKKLGKVKILAISPDPIDKVKGLAERVAAKTGGPLEGVALLSDADHRTIDSYGLLNEAAAARQRFLPHPTTLVIDAMGVVRWRFVEKDYKLRPTNEAIVEALLSVR